MSQSPIGPYNILEELSRDETGIVYRAERDFEGQKREFALKVLNSANTAEIEALAVLDHPILVRLRDSGRTDSDGFPYLVTDLVIGEPLDRYCWSHELSPRGLGELAAKISRSLEYAHQQLTAHHNLKFTNILVRDGGEPVVLGFGAVHGNSLNGLSAAADVEALGSLLGKLMQSGAEPELDAIIGKASGTRAGSRYDSMSEMAADLEVYAAGRPVAAYKNSFAYRIGKFLRRHQTLLMAPAGLVFLLWAVVATIRVAGQELNDFKRSSSQSPEIRLAPRSPAALFAWELVYSLLGKYSHSLSLASPRRERELLNRIGRSLDEIKGRGVQESTSGYSLGRAYQALSCWQDSPQDERSLQQARYYFVKTADSLEVNDKPSRDRIEKLWIPMIDAALALARASEPFMKLDPKLRNSFLEGRPFHERNPQPDAPISYLCGELPLK